LPAQTTTPAAASDVRKELIGQIEDAERKLVALAEATPPDKYGWRPAAGVRSVSEVYMHIVGANYLFPGIVGHKRPADVALTRESEKTVTDKAQVLDYLRKSFAFAKQAAMSVPEQELGTSVNMFGSPSTKRGVLVLLATHAHEHLGQSIAYARMNGVVPPWSRGTDGDR
ncbi:MAG TPA: DinB family protein, partial [Gemmatimonadaceae bacterium]|nr:DinB family protein [Gemmatimonadaceae bacterium]